jgi:hypothetical protein
MRAFGRILLPWLIASAANAGPISTERKSQLHVTQTPDANSEMATALFMQWIIR